ncbi:hypothetical protein CSB45_02535 [candidate division KSB3 bacterium]|uniref:Glycosyl transferase n=1 Tax=candidate division KSB3 bacterium TaxID=2044937 RepID=A0A2G6E9Y9_9BACT|nr:MAG: hypothetical protein CSB45_02535 [candidate division KSB3 bacterium]PIE30957.1 MAG: hypothetical protein CSA57_01150 [candidate division KSB3 bacterium]
MNRSRKQKIVYLIGTLDAGGAERQIIEVASRVHPDLFETRLYCLHGGGPLETLARERGVHLTMFHAFHRRNASIENASPIPFRRIRQFGALYRYLRREQPDIVHCYMFAPSVYGGWAARLSGCAHIITSRRCLGYFKDGKALLQMLENSVNRFSDRVLVNSLALRDDVLARERISDEKIELIYNGVDIERYAPQASNRAFVTHKKRELGIPDHAPVIGIIANLYRYKGHREFIIAASEVRQHYPDARFLCIGREGNMEQELQALIENYALQQHVKLVGGVTNVEDWLQLIDIQVSASYEEGFSNVILEGMSSGKALVATHVGGTPEAILDNETGLLIPPKDPQALSQAILRFLNAPAFASRCRENAVKRVKEYFSMEKMIDKFEKLYCSLSAS